MRTNLVLLALALAASTPAACSSSTSSTTGTGGTSASSTSSGATSSSVSTSTSTSTSSSGSGGSSASSSGSTSSGSAGAGGGGPPTAADLLALTAKCTQVSGGLYKTDADPNIQPTIPICSLPGAFFWQADMDIDCDGKTTQACNLNTDPAYQDQTSATDSQGNALDSAALPYFVIPLPNKNLWSYQQAGIQLGAVGAIIYQGQLVYAVFGDEGPSTIIGEASVATANALGVPSNPSTGGVDSGVTYIVFSGPGAVVSPIEDHAAAVALGEQLAAQLVKAAKP